MGIILSNNGLSGQLTMGLDRRGWKENRDMMEKLFGKSGVCSSNERRATPTNFQIPVATCSRVQPQDPLSLINGLKFSQGD
jgi:hypothetical protein